MAFYSLPKELSIFSCRNVFCPIFSRWTIVKKKKKIEKVLTINMPPFSRLWPFTHIWKLCLPLSTTPKKGSIDHTSWSDWASNIYIYFLWISFSPFFSLSSLLLDRSSGADHVKRSNRRFGWRVVSCSEEWTAVGQSSITHVRPDFVCVCAET